MNDLMKKITVTSLLVSSSLMNTAFAATGELPAVSTTLTNRVVSSPIIADDSQSLPAAFILNDKILKPNTITTPFTSPSGALYIPFKLFSNELDYKVTWDAKERSVTLELPTQTTKFQLLKDTTSEYGMTLKTIDGRTFSAQIIMGSLYVSPEIFREALNGVVVFDHLNQLRIDAEKYAPDEASTLGEIINIENGKDGVQLLVKGEKYGAFGLNEVSLAVKMTAPVKLSNGNVVSLSDLKVGDRIYIKYGKALTKSLPAIGQAESVVLLKDEGLFEGKVYLKQTSSEGIAATSRQLRVVGTSEFVVSVNEKTVISDSKGDIKSFDDLSEGMILKIVTAPYAAMSYPAQTAAYRIEIVK